MNVEHAAFAETGMYSFHSQWRAASACLLWKDYQTAITLWTLLLPCSVSELFTESAYREIGV